MMVAVLWCLILALHVSAGYIGSSILRRSSNMYRTWGQFRCRASSPLYGRDPDGSPPPAPEPVPIQQGEERGREGERQQVLDREQAAVKSSFEARLNELRFGYESNETATGGWTIAAGSPRKPAVICGSALEYDKRGCGETMSTTLTRRTRSSTISTLRSLPCFQDDGESGSTCPYVRLRCSRGHEWKAVPGSEVSMKCPICSASKTASVAKRKGSPRKPKISIYNRVTAHATSKGGVCHLHPEDNHSLHWNSSVPFECVNGHKWTATVTNILKKESWCAQCLAEERLFLMQETAACFDGQFLGFVEDMSRHKKLLRYQFLEGTFGMAYEDFDSSTGMFRIRKGQAAAAPKWPSSETVRTKAKKGATVSSTNGTGGKAEMKTKKRKPLSFSQSPAYWECSQGHIFVQSSNNIRRKQGSARKCSWCPDCSKAGLKFAWFPTAKEKSFAIKKKKEAQRR